MQYIPVVGGYIILGGRKWKVISFEEKSQKIYVTKFKQGDLPRFNSDSPPIDILIVQKMKEIYISEDIYSYLDNCGKESLESSRRFFNANHLDRISLFTYGNQTFLFTWMGERINHTLVLLLSLIDGRRRFHNHIVVSDVTMDILLKLKAVEKPDCMILTELISNRKNKEEQKYDYLLSDNLLNLEYASVNLDIEGAWEYLQSVCL